MLLPPVLTGSSEQSLGKFCKGNCKPLCEFCPFPGWKDAATEAQCPQCRVVATCEVLSTIAWSPRCVKAQGEGLPQGVHLTL